MKDKYKDYVGKYEPPVYWGKPEKDEVKNYERSCQNCQKIIVVNSPYLRRCKNCREMF